MSKKGTPSSFRVPNSIMQGLVTLTPAELNKLQPSSLVTLLGLFTLVNPKRPEAEVTATVSQILEIIEIGKAVAHAVNREWTNKGGERKTRRYKSRRFSPRQRKAVEEALRELHAKTVSVQRYDPKTKQKLENRIVHVLDMFGYRYEVHGERLDVDDLPPGLEKENVGSGDRPLWKVRRQTENGERYERPAGILFRLNAELAQELAKKKGTIGFTVVAQQIFSVLRQFANSPNRMRLLLLIIRQTEEQFSRRLRKLVQELGWDIGHLKRGVTDITETLHRLTSLGIVRQFNIDELKDRLEIVANRQWWHQPAGRLAQAQTPKRGSK